MTPENRLTLSYIRAHPPDAARSLERLPAESGGALLEALDIDAAAALVAAMAPLKAAGCLAQMAPSRAAAALQAIQPAAAALILRCMTSTSSQDLLDRFDALARLRVRRLLHRRPDTVGAVMSPAAPAVGAAITVGDAVKRIQALRSALPCQVYLVDEAHKLVGAVDAGALLSAGARRPLQSLSGQPVAALNASASLAAALNHRGWHTRHVLPVTEHDGTLVGTVDRQVLMDATEAVRPTTHEDAFGGLLELVNLYWIALAETVQLIAGAGGEQRPR